MPNLPPVFFSVVVPTCRRPDLLASCLSRLAPDQQRCPQGGYEVIVTDDGREPVSRPVIGPHASWARWVAGPGRGPAANRNGGASQARGSWIVFLDDDCLPDPGWLCAYAEAIHQHPECAAFEGRVYAPRPKAHVGEFAPLNETGGFLWSCNFAIQAQLFRELGGFDERFLHAAMEDVDLGYRLKQRHLEFRFVAQAAVCHPWRDGQRWLSLQQHQQATLTYLAIHPEERSRINARHYLRWTAGVFWRTTLPALAGLRWRGLGSVLLEHLAALQMALRLGLQRSSR